MATYEDGPGESGEIATDGRRRRDAAGTAVSAGGEAGSRPGEGSRPGAEGGGRPPAEGRPSAPLLKEATVLSRGYRALTLGIVSVVFLIAFEATAVGTAMPVAADELDGVSAYAFAFSALFSSAVLVLVL